MNVIARRRRQPAAPITRAEQERDLQHRARRWAAATAVTWPVWALTGAPTGLPRVDAPTSHHVVATLGIWPLYLMVGGLADLARRARRTYPEQPPDDVDD